MMQPKSTLEMRVGELLVKLGFLDERQLEQALTVQREQARYKPLGEICKELGFISGGVLRDILFRYRKQILLGELLHKMGVISDDQLNEALKEHKKSGEKLGQILVKKGFVTSSDLIDSLCIQLGINKIHPKKDLIDRALLNQANESYFRKKRVVPLRLDKEKRILMVVMEDPTDSETIGDLQKMFNAAIEPAICPSGEIELLLKEIFDVWFDSR
jgi:type IV pilus assembly protein PilB